MSFEVLKAMFTLPNILMMNIGLAAGTVIGAMPGLNVIFAIAILLPITFGMDSLPGMYLMLASYCGATYGGSITQEAVGSSGLKGGNVSGNCHYCPALVCRAFCGDERAASIGCFDGYHA